MIDFLDQKGNYKVNCKFEKPLFIDLEMLLPMTFMDIIILILLHIVLQSVRVSKSIHKEQRVVRRQLQRAIQFDYSYFKLDY